MYTLNTVFVYYDESSLFNTNNYYNTFIQEDDKRAWQSWLAVAIQVEGKLGSFLPRLYIIRFIKVLLCLLLANWIK